MIIALHAMRETIELNNLMGMILVNASAMKGIMMIIQIVFANNAQHFGNFNINYF